ncbi:MAG: hypothetical protein QXK37_05825 [Candidatus Woesearchaeota archaeon]
MASATAKARRRIVAMSGLTPLLELKNLSMLAPPFFIRHHISDFDLLS